MLAAPLSERIEEPIEGVVLDVDVIANLKILGRVVLLREETGRPRVIKRMLAGIKVRMIDAQEISRPGADGLEELPWILCLQ